jgi:hypothetical protein
MAGANVAGVAVSDDRKRLQVDFGGGMMHDRNCHSHSAPAIDRSAIALIHQ